MLKPKFFSLIKDLKDYSLSQFITDCISGVIVGIVALPLAIAFGIASGVSPEKSLITAITGGFIVSFLGGSRVQIAGPTGAFVVIVYGIIQKYGIEGLYVSTIMAGIVLIILGYARIGSMIKFMPYPVVVGFTSGIAVIIFSSQIKDFLGLQMGAVPAEFFQKWIEYGQHINSVNIYALLISAGTMFVIIFWKKINKQIPGSLIALIFSTLIVHFLKLPVETIGSRFGEIPNNFPAPMIPKIDLETIRHLTSPILAIALLGGIESLLSAVVADGMTGGRHRSNMELIAQGIANIVSPIFGGIPVTGAIARTATNINNGGRTPVAGIVHAFVLLLIMLFLGKWVIYIPLACLAGILVIVAYNMSEWHSFVMLLKSPRSDVAVLWGTFLITVIVDLTMAIQIGVILSIFLFMRRMAMITNVRVITDQMEDADEESDDPNAIEKKFVPPGVEIYEINGPFFFGASYKFMEAMNATGKIPKVRIIRMRNVLSLDATGLNAIREQHKSSIRQGVPFIISGIHTQPLLVFEQSGLLKTIGEENVYRNIDEALAGAVQLVQVKQK
ncbi:MAG: SulP family inorganic anion transporter [Candidatus Omnitrophota bacterium]